MASVSPSIVGGSSADMPGKENEGTEQKGKSFVQAIESDAPVDNLTFAMMVAMDILFWVPLCYRQYGNTMHYNCVITHYFSFIFLTDLGAFYLPKTRRHWWNFFRCFSSAQVIQFELQLWYAGVNDGVLSQGPWPTGGPVLASRIAVAMIRLLQSAYLIAKFGPWMCHWSSLPMYAKQFYRLGTSGFPYKPFDLFSWVFFSVFFSWLFAYLHWTYGEQRVIAPIVNFQALNGVSNFGKTLLLHILIARPRKRGIFALLSTLGFLIQWPMMLDMYRLAIIPYGHAIAELDAIANVAASFSSPDVPLLYQTYEPGLQEDREETRALI